MGEDQNKIIYADFWSNESTDATIIEHAVSVLHQMYEYITQLSSITATWYQNSDTIEELNTARITITKSGFDSYYTIEVTTSGVTTGKCKYNVSFVCKTGKAVSLNTTTSDLATWKTCGVRFMYLFTPDLSTFYAYTFTSAEPDTIFDSAFCMFASTENGTNIYHTSSRSFYKDDGTTKTLSTTIDNSGPTNKIILVNIEIAGSKVKGLHIVRFSTWTAGSFEGYLNIEGYGKYCSFGYGVVYYTYAVKLAD